MFFVYLCVWWSECQKLEVVAQVISSCESVMEQLERPECMHMMWICMSVCVTGKHPARLGGEHAETLGSQAVEQP